MRSFSWDYDGSLLHNTAWTPWLTAIHKSTLGEKKNILLNSSFSHSTKCEYCSSTCESTQATSVHPEQNSDFSPAQAALWISVGLWRGLKNMPLKIVNRFIYKGEWLVMSLWQLMFLYVISWVNLKHACKYAAKNNLLELCVQYKQPIIISEMI